MITLYDDQAEFVDKLRTALKQGYRSILGVASPAFGKTVVAGYITAQARQKSDASTWFLVHRKNLLRQTSKSFWKSKIEHGLMTSGRRQSKMPIQVGTIGTVHSRLSKLTPPNILFVDEAHLSRGKMFETVIRWALDHGTIVIGLTGTPERLDGKSLGDLFEVLIEAKSTRWLIEQGRLSDYEIYTTPVMPDLSAVKKSGGDFNREQLAEAMDKRHLVGNAITHWRKHALGLRTVVYCVNVKHSKHTAETFNAAGIPAVHVDGESTEAEIKAACEGLADGRYKVLCNCELVIEGFDLSAQVGRDATLECCMLLRPTESLARYLQMVFRALRKKPKPAVILDHAGCVHKPGFGLPDDPREWSLAGRTKRKRKAKDEDDESELTTQQCSGPNGCYAIFRKGPTHCPNCGEELPGNKRQDLQVIDAELQKVDMEAVRRERKREQGKARTLHDLVALGVRRGMKKPAEWAAITQAARERRKPTGKEFNEAKQILIEVRRNEQRRDNHNNEERV